MTWESRGRPTREDRVTNCATPFVSEDELLGELPGQGADLRSMPLSISLRIWNVTWASDSNYPEVPMFSRGKQTQSWKQTAHRAPAEQMANQNTSEVQRLEYRQ